MKTPLFFVVPLLSIVVGCSTSQNAELPNVNIPTAVSANLYLARSSIWKPTEFEQHAIKGTKLLSECGTVKGNRTLVAQQDMITLSEENLTKIKSLAGNLSTSVAKHGLKYETPATKERFFDGGKLLLTITIDGAVTSIDTSVDSIAEPSSPQELALAKLVSTLRGNSAALCGNPTFFGITKS